MDRDGLRWIQMVWDGLILIEMVWDGLRLIEMVLDGLRTIEMVGSIWVEMDSSIEIDWTGLRWIEMVGLRWIYYHSQPPLAAASMHCNSHSSLKPAFICKYASMQVCNYASVPRLLFVLYHQKHPNSCFYSRFLPTSEVGCGSSHSRKDLSAHEQSRFAGLHSGNLGWDRLKCIQKDWFVSIYEQSRFAGLHSGNMSQIWLRWIQVVWDGLRWIHIDWNLDAWALSNLG